jgi:putative ABC transport system permease protein
VVALLSRDFILLVLVASVLIIPVVYIAIGHWLENFAYHMEIRWWLLLMPVLLVWLMALFTISIQTVKASLANPARTLRYE